ncbi:MULTISPECIES: Rossmann-like domain-containing protein [Dehalobacter]|uniref:Uncharacterized protein n=1 Tax=Dehalobacter restrictus TaxID=55583 RepID=A0A857DG04_9FIRM|nr:MULTISPECIES: DUF364 domain-containing protein [Dehalobacter]EQB22006.1 hypothetical protein UNSWDHB_667 [Dehalobacter sp. UNSWDHB]QGZ99185.1 hypothetical protein GQ588_00120 [Dehalobacter restrictus]
MILERVYELALPRLEGKKIREVRVGLGLMAVELDDGSLGVTYVLRKETVDGCSLLPQGGKLIGMPAQEIAGWALRGNNVISSAMGLAVLNSVAGFGNLEQVENAGGSDAAFSVEIKPTDTVGVIGHIGPIIFNLQGKVQNLLVFERGENLLKGVYPESKEPELLPECQVIYVSSTSLINRTLESVLGYCTDARDVVMVGSSTPLYPQAFVGTGVTMLSGMRWLPEHRDPILTGISQCAGIRQLSQYAQKISVTV